jgi:hypothetical protein
MALGGRQLSLLRQAPRLRRVAWVCVAVFGVAFINYVLGGPGHDLFIYLAVLVQLGLFWLVAAMVRERLDSRIESILGWTRHSAPRRRTPTSVQRQRWK